MNHCKTCRHYKPSAAPDEWGGKCLRIKHGNGDTNFMGAYGDRYAAKEGYGTFTLEELDKELLRLADAEKAAVTDGSGYHAALCVRDDFGCVLHEEK